MEIKKVEILVFAQESADCICVTINGELSILIDCGKASCCDNVVKRLNKENKKINYILITHTHRDHLGGFTKILDSIYKDTTFKGVILWMNKSLESSPLVLNVIKKIKERKVTYYCPGENNEKNMLFNENIKLLYPLKNQNYDIDDKNNNSIIIAFKLMDKYIIFTGDAPSEKEIGIIQNHREIIENAIIIKLGHHGSRTSSSTKYINAIDKDVIERVLCCTRSNWSRKPPCNEKISQVESMLEVAVSCTGRDNISRDIKVICEVQPDGTIKVT